MLILLPNLLGGDDTDLLPPLVAPAVKSLDGLIAESDRAGRRFLDRYREGRSVPIALLSEDPKFLLEPVIEGQTWGVVSDAGLPCLADPGAKLVAKAHRLNLPIQAIPGPSSLFLALMLSGFPAQQFTFHGYFKRDRKQHIKEMERAKGTHLAIEAPYRNEHALKDLLETLRPTTRLCVAVDLTLPTQEVISKPLSHWKELPTIHKRPAVFLIHSV